jgi:hypothetical protein
LEDLVSNVDDTDKIREALIGYAREFFHECRTSEDLYGRLVISFNTLSTEIIELNKRGRVHPELAEAWSWYSIAVPTMIKIALRGTPAYGTRELEQQLVDGFIAALKASTTTTIVKPGPPPPAPGIFIAKPPAPARDPDAIDFPTVEGPTKH